MSKWLSSQLHPLYRSSIKHWLGPSSVSANDAADTGTLFINKVSDEFEATSMVGVMDRRPVIAIYLLGIVFGKTYLIVEEVWSQYYFDNA